MARVPRSGTAPWAGSAIGVGATALLGLVLLPIRKEITPATGTFVGNFELVRVTNLTPGSTSSLGLVNLATRVANVTIVAGGVNEELTLEFRNRRTITGFIAKKCHI